MIHFHSFFLFLIATIYVDAQSWPTFFPIDTTTTTITITPNFSTESTITTQNPITDRSKTTPEKITTKMPLTSHFPTESTTIKPNTTTEKLTTKTMTTTTKQTPTEPLTTITNKSTIKTTENTPQIITVTEYEPSTKSPYITVTFPFSQKTTTISSSTSTSSSSEMSSTTQGTSKKTPTTTESTSSTSNNEMTTQELSTTITTTTTTLKSTTLDSSTSPNTGTTITEKTTTFTPITPPTPPSPISPSQPWNLTYDSKGITNCIMATFATKINIDYKTIDNKTITTGFDIPENATVCNSKSKCLKDEDNQTFVLNFDIESGLEGFFMLVFGKNHKNNDSIVTKIETEFKITEKLFPGIAKEYLNKFVSIFVHNTSLFDTPTINSYSCKSPLLIVLDNIKVKDIENDNQECSLRNSTVQISSIHWQAFLPWNKTVTNFYDAFECDANLQPISNAIPITVGVILLSMVTIVLAAYIIGRRRQAKQANGIVNYSQMEE